MHYRGRLQADRRLPQRQIVVTSNDPVTPVVTVPPQGVGVETKIHHPPSPLQSSAPDRGLSLPRIPGSAWIYNRGPG